MYVSLCTIRIYQFATFNRRIIFARCRLVRSNWGEPNLKGILGLVTRHITSFPYALPEEIKNEKRQGSSTKLYV